MVVVPLRVAPTLSLILKSCQMAAMKRNYKRNVSSSFVPRFAGKCSAEDEKLKLERLGKREYYLRQAMANRLERGEPDGSITKEKVFLLRDHLRKVKKRKDAIEKKMEQEQIDNGWL